MSMGLASKGLLGNPLICYDNFLGRDHNKLVFSINPCGGIYSNMYTPCRASLSDSELVRLKVLLSGHDCCNKSIVLGGLGGYIIDVPHE